jgi:hypothetical protein
MSPERKLRPTNDLLVTAYTLMNNPGRTRIVHCAIEKKDLHCAEVLSICSFTFTQVGQN